MQLQDRLHYITAIIQTEFDNSSSSGTGFFYFETIENPDSELNSKIPKLKDVWLVTNRHIVLERSNEVVEETGELSEQEVLPWSFTFSQRILSPFVLKVGKAEIEEKTWTIHSVEPEDKSNVEVEWKDFPLDRDELHERLLVTPNRNIDVAIIRVTDLTLEKIKNQFELFVEEGRHQIDELYWFPHAVSQKDLPEKMSIEVEAGDDVLVIGYPQGFYDEASKFPIVKSGIIASKWGALFDGNPYFLVDAKLFPGSSGSLVITKPSIKSSPLKEATDSPRKEFAFLGIYSGELKVELPPIEFEDFKIIQKEKAGVGFVWYGHLIEKIIKDGVKMS